MGFQVFTNRLDTPPGTNSEGHDHTPRSIFLHWWSVKMRSIVLVVSVRSIRDCGLWYQSLYQIFLFIGYSFRWQVSLCLLNSLQRASYFTYKVYYSIHPSYLMRYLGPLPYLLWSCFLMSTIVFPFDALFAWCVWNLSGSMLMVVFGDVGIG